jgi:hypothetical protein
LRAESQASIIKATATAFVTKLEPAIQVEGLSNALDLLTTDDCSSTRQEKLLSGSDDGR